MNEQTSEQRLDVVRVAGLRARQTSQGFEHKGMDLQGFGILGEIVPEENRSTAFAIAAAMLSKGVPVYYSYKLRAISTDPTFGMTPSLAPNFAKTGPLRVVAIDGIWMFSTSVGHLVITLEDGPLAQIDVDDPSAFIGWLHMSDLDMLTLNERTLDTAPPRTWEQGSFIVDEEPRP